MRMITRQILGSLLLLALFTGCSRPIAYFQPSLYERVVATPTAIEPLVADQNPVYQVQVVVDSSAQQLAQPSSTLDEGNAMVSNNNKLATTKVNQRHLYASRMLLASTSSKTGAGHNETLGSGKMTFVQRLMVKKLNHTIRRQLSPNNPEKTWASKSILAIGAILVLGGILLLAFTTGGGFALGSIAVAAGLVILLIELL